jgi:hypothetical protein
MQVFSVSGRSSQPLLLSGFPTSGIRLICVAGVEAQAQPLLRLPVITPHIDACALINVSSDGIFELNLEDDALKDLILDPDKAYEVALQDLADALLTINSDGEITVNTAEVLSSALEALSLGEVALSIKPDGYAIFSLAQDRSYVIDVEQDAEAILDISENAGIILDVEACE